MTAHKVRTILPIPIRVKFEREIAIEARIADWSGLCTLLDWAALNSPTPELTELAHQWSEQLQVIMEGEDRE